MKRTPPKEVWMVLHPEGRKRLQKLMLIQGVSQRDVAEAAGWKSHSYLGRMLRGQVTTCDNDAAVRIAHYLEVDIYDLFTSDSRQFDQRESA